MTVALITIICVGFASSSKDDNNKPNEHLTTVSGKWGNTLIDGGVGFNFDSRYGIEFKYDGTYSYIDPNRSITGNYKVVEKKESKGVLSYTGFDGNEYEIEYDGTLHKILVSGSLNFDQIWIYVFKNINNIVIHLYANNEFVENLNMFYKLSE